MRCFKIGEGVRDGFTRDMAMEELGGGGGGLMGSIGKCGVARLVLVAERMGG